MVASCEAFGFTEAIRRATISRNDAAYPYNLCRKLTVIVHSNACSTGRVTKPSARRRAVRVLDLDPT
jgi:hypothetical protein